MLVLLSLLAPGWLLVTEQQPQQPCSSLSALKAALTGRLGAHSHRGDHIKMSSGGHSKRFPPVSHVLTDTSTVIESRNRLTVTRRVKPPMRRNRAELDWLPACLWGVMLMPVCHPSWTTLTKSFVYMCATCVCTQGCYPAQLALSHIQISNEVTAATLYQIFCNVRLFYMLTSKKCCFSRLYSWFLYRFQGMNKKPKSHALLKLLLSRLSQVTGLWNVTAITVGLGNISLLYWYRDMRLDIV